MPPTSRPLSVLALVGALAASTFAGSPTIEETILGPTNAGGIFTISPKGARIAYLGRNDGKLTVRVDGVEGPAFDEVYKASGGSAFFPAKAGVWAGTLGGTEGRDAPVLFSRDSTHFAYAGTQGGDYVVIHDGKEIGRGPWQLMGRRGLTLSSGGTHVYWAEAKLEQGQTIARTLVSGKPGPWTFGTVDVTFSPDESRYAYFISRTVDSENPVLIIDGKPASYEGSNPVFTADGKLLLTTGMVDDQAALLVDGKPVIKGVQVSKVVVAPVGRRYAAIVRQIVKNQGIDFLYIDGKQVPGSEHAQNVWFSPDGKRTAAVCRDAFGGPSTMLVDGKATSFNRIDAQPPYWTPDSSKIIYTAGTATGNVVVVEGESFTYPRTFTGVFLPEEGGTYGWGTLGAGAEGHSLVIGGQSVLPAGVYPSSKVVLTRDGSRHAYVVNKYGRSDVSGLVIDGVIQPGFFPGQFGRWMTSELIALTPLVFSPDGKHAATLGRVAPAQRHSLYLDGVIVHPDIGFAIYPTFSPDSRHFYWLTDAEPGKPQFRTAVYVDGQLAVSAHGYFFREFPNTFEVDADGVATYLAVDGDLAKRYRITPAADTSVATLLAGGTARVAAAPATPKPPVTAAPQTPAPKPTAPMATAKPAVPPPATALTWNDLVRRPETRPTACTVNKPFAFQGGAKVAAGTTVNVIDVKPTELLVGTPDGRINFTVKPDDTDILAAANAAWAPLTPAARALTYPTLLAQRGLWPYRLKLGAAFELNGRTTRVGEVAILLGLEGDRLLVCLEGGNVSFTVEPHETDLLAQARAHLADDLKNPGRLVDELSGRLVSPVDGASVPLAADLRPKYVVLYRGAGWCPPCQVFSPKLVRVFKDKAPAATDVLAVFVSSDRSPAEAKAYTTKNGFSWPTLFFKSRAQLPAFNTLFGDAIPQLVVTDRHGTVLIDSNTVGTDAALEALIQLL